MLRTWFVALAAVAGMTWISLPAVASPRGPASADSVSQPHSFVSHVQICPLSGCGDPSRPVCAGDSLVVLLDGAFPSGCYSLLSVDLFIPPWAQPSDVRTVVPWVRLRYEDQTCLGPCPLNVPTFQARVVLPPVPPGTYGLTVMQQPVGCDTVPVLFNPVSFSVGDSCDSLPPPPSGLPYVDRVAFCRTEGPDACQPICPTDSVVMKIAGTFPNTCYSVKKIEVLPSIATVYPPIPSVRVVVDNGCCLAGPCTAQPTPWSAAVKLPTLPPGTHPVVLSVAEVCCSDSVPPDPPQAGFHVAVSGDCPVLPYLHSVLFCGNTRTDSGGVIPCQPVCAGDSISVILSGIFPNECFDVVRVDVVPPPPTFREAPPSLLVVVDNHCCQDRICLPDARSWHRLVKLPPMPAGSYDLTVRVAELCCSDWAPPGSNWPSANFAFAVDTCSAPPTEACLWGGWYHPNGAGGCDAFLENGSPTVLFTVNSNRALAGLEGEFHLGYSSSALAMTPPLPPPVITGIVPMGVASGMHVRWTATEGGARFVLFAGDGAPIPPSPPFTGDPVPVLAVTARMPDGVTPPGDIAIYVGRLLGADVSGDGVPTCPVPDNAMLALYPARICTSVGCDFNRDGIANIRDLVMMVRCLRSAACPSPQQSDCDSDGGFDLDDVLCCAWTMLRRSPCPGCPSDTTPPRKDEGVRLVMDALEATAGEVRAGLRIDGADRVGGVRLEFRFPADRYDFVGLDGIGNDWLALTDVDGDAIVVGLIRLGEVDGVLAAQSATCSGTLKLRLKPGMSPGGELTAASAEFSGTDGVRLEVAPGTGTLPLSSGAEFALSENGPDPFTGTTRFALTLPQAADVDLGVFDVGGRRVATLHNGRLAAGVTPFTWDASSDHGGRVASGVYFYRATVGGRTLAKKMVVLRD